MKLRTQIMLVRGIIWPSVALGILWLTAASLFGIFLTGWWLLFSKVIVQRRLLPQLFRYARCGNGDCNRLIPLVQFWGCTGGHYKHPVPVHALAYRCSKDHDMKDFECPNCGATIQLQKGTSNSLVKGQIYGNPRLVTADEDKPVELCSFFKQWYSHATQPERRLFLGYSRTHDYSRFRKIIRKLCKLSVRKELWVAESTHSLSMSFLGASGSGKSHLMTDIIYQKMTMGEGLTVIDPTGDLIDDIVCRVPDHRRDDVLLYRISEPWCPLRLNLLHTFNDIEELNINNEVVNCIQRLASSWGSNIGLYIRRAVETVRLKGGSLQDVYNLFVDSQYRDYIAERTPNRELRQFWEEEYPRISSASKAATTNKLVDIVQHKILSPMICSRQNNFDANKIIEKSNIVLLDLSTGSHVTDVNSIVGTFVFTKLIAAAWLRGKLSRQHRKMKRVPHSIFVDEAHNYISKEMGLQKIISEARKFKLTLALATTDINLLGDELKGVLLNNVGLMSVFRAGERDASLFKRELLGATTEDIMLLDKGQCIVRNHRTTQHIRTRHPIPRPNSDPTIYIEKRMRSLNASIVQEETPTAEVSVGVTPQPQPEIQVPVVCDGVF